MIDPAHELSITNQAEALNISRGSVYYLPRPVPDADLTIMRRSTAHLEFPFAGSRMLQGLLVAEGHKIGRRHVKTLMKRMEIEALYRRPRTTKPERGHKIYRICCAGWRSRGPTRCGRWTLPTSRWRAASSIWRLCSIGSSRRVLSWRLSITMEAAFCVETLEDALARHGKPDIFNTDQGSQFTGTTFTGVLIDKRYRHQHGWQGRLAGQCLRRAAVAQRQIRGGLSASLRQRQRGPHFDRPILQLL